MTVEEEQGNAVFGVHFAVKSFKQLYITNKTERFGFKGAWACRVHCETRLAYSVTVRILA